MHEQEYNSFHEEGKSAGPVVGAVIIILIMIIGALYFWGAELNRKEKETPEQVTSAVDTVLTELQTQSSSDDLTSIKNDLKATTLNGLDSDVNAAKTDLPK